MPVDANTASNRYGQGIRDKMGGAEAYQQAAGASSPAEAARILEQQRQSNLSLSDMVSAYERAYNAGGFNTGGGDNFQ